MTTRPLKSLKAYLNRPGVEFFSLVLLVNLPMILLADPSRLISLTTLFFTSVLASAYASSRWLDGFVVGKSAGQQAGIMQNETPTSIVGNQEGRP